MSSLKEKLNQVPWEQVSHAYGPATDTPTHLLALLSENAEERERALDELWASICHQWSVYEASGAAVPFLISILQAVPDEQKPSILGLLSGLAGYYWYKHRDKVTLEMDHSGQESRQRWKSIRQFLQQGNKYHKPQWMERTHRLVGEGLPTYLSLLQSTDENTVRETLDLLACFQELNSAIIPAVMQLFSETADPLIKASALDSLSTLLDAQSPYWEHYHRLVNANPADVHPVVRYAAAHSLAVHHSGDIPSTAADILVERMLEPCTDDVAEDKDSESSGEEHGRDYYQLDCRSLSCLGVPTGLQALTRALEQGASRWSILDTMRVAEALLDVAFFGCWIENRYWGYRTTHASPLEVTSLNNPEDPYYDQEIPDLSDDNAYFQFEYSEKHTSISEFFIEVFGYDQSEAAKLKLRFEQQGLQSLLDYQRDALQTVLHCEALWTLKHNLLEIYGLPTSREAVDDLWKK